MKSIKRMYFHYGNFKLQSALSFHTLNILEFFVLLLFILWLIAGITVGDVISTFLTALIVGPTTSLLEGYKARKERFRKKYNLQ